MRWRFCDPKCAAFARATTAAAAQTVFAIWVCAIQIRFMRGFENGASAVPNDPSAAAARAELSPHVTSGSAQATYNVPDTPRHGLTSAPCCTVGPYPDTWLNDPRRLGARGEFVARRRRHRYNRSPREALARANSATDYDNSRDRRPEAHNMSARVFMAGAEAWSCMIWVNTYAPRSTPRRWRLQGQRRTCRLACSSDTSAGWHLRLCRARSWIYIGTATHYLCPTRSAITRFLDGAG